MKSMRHLRLRRELDEYLSRRANRHKLVKAKDLPKQRQLQKNHATLQEQSIDAEGVSGGNGVLIVDSGQQNFFSMLHDKIINSFIKKKTKD